MSPNSPSTAAGRGKLIAFGEHAVVYGRPAVACSLPMGARASISAVSGPTVIEAPDGPIALDEKIRRAQRLLLEHFAIDPESVSIDIELSIPVGAGLGSSAAMAVALARCAARYAGLDLDDGQTRDMIAQSVSASEGVFHGNASGIDQQAAMGSGFFTFVRRPDGAHMTALDVAPAPWLIARVAPSASTSKMVESVARLRERNPTLIESLFDDFEALALMGAKALTERRLKDAGELMNINQGLLSAIGVSTPALESACQAAREAGAFGAKLTGAGGGGCIVALAGDDPRAVVSALKAHGDVFDFTLPPAH